MSRALVRQLKRNAKKRGGENGGCAGCTVDRGGLLRVTDTPAANVADLAPAGGEA